MGSESYHETRPSPTGDGLLHTIRAALKANGISSKQIDYVNAHGTATALGDVAEARALREGFGEDVPVSSTKSQTGHLLGAASSVEIGIAALALRDGWTPGNANLAEPDEECRLNLVPPSGTACDLRVAASVSAGFGGQVGVAIMTREEDAP